MDAFKPLPDLSKLAGLYFPGRDAGLVAQRINAAAKMYQLVKCLGEARLGRSERRRLVGKIAKSAAQLTELLQCLDSQTGTALEGTRSIEEIREQLSGLSHSASHLFKLLPSKGRNAEEARGALIQDLNALWVREGHEQPRRHSDRSLDEKQRWGAFGDFVRDVLSYIDPIAIEGLEHVLRRVLKRDGQQTG